MFAVIAAWIESVQPLYMVNIVQGLTITSCLLIVATGKHRDLMVWAAGFALYTLSFVFFGLRDELPMTVSVIGGNAALAFMFAMFIEGLARLYTVPLPRWLIWSPPMLSMVAFIAYLDNFDARIIIGAISSSYHSILVIFLASWGLRSSTGRGRWIIFSAIVFHAGIFLTRGLLIAIGVIDGSGFLSPSVEQSIYFSLLLSAVLMFAIGLLVIYKEHAETDAWQEAHYDPLTKVANRRVLKQRLKALAMDPEKHQSYSAMLLLDLDNFKSLNDTYGHSAGDRLLILVAERIRDCLYGSDQIIRLGGDEFVILLEGMGDKLDHAENSALNVASKVLRQLHQPYQLEVDMGNNEPVLKLEYTVTASMGVELFLCCDANQEKIMSQVDLLMYQVKKSGKNGICCRNIVYSISDDGLVDVARHIGESESTPA